MENTGSETAEPAGYTSLACRVEEDGNYSCGVVWKGSILPSHLVEIAIRIAELYLEMFPNAEESERLGRLKRVRPSHVLESGTIHLEF